MSLIIVLALFRQTDVERTVSVRHVHGAGVRSIAFSPDLKRFATGGVDRSVRVWDLQSGKELLELEAAAGGVPAMTFTPDGARLIAGGGDGSVQIWDASTGKALTSLPGHRLGIYSLAISPDGGLLASGDGESQIRFTDLSTARELRTVRAPEVLQQTTLRTSQPGIYDLTISPDGKSAVSAELSGWLRVWVPGSDQPVQALHGHGAGINAAAWSPDGKLVATASADGTVGLWDVAVGRRVGFMTGASRREDNALGGVHFHLPGLHSAAFSPDGLLVAAGESYSGAVNVWEVASGSLLRRFEQHEGGVIRVAFAPDGRRLLSGGSDRTVRIWDLDPAKSRVEGAGEAVVGLLGDPNGKAAWSAVWTLVSLGEASLPALRERLKSEVAPEARIRELVLQLDDDDLQRRDEAMGELSGLGPLAERPLRRLAEEGTEEQKARVAPLLKELESPRVRGTALARLRALQAAERLGAVELLRAVAEGSPSDRERFVARGALARRSNR